MKIVPREVLMYETMDGHCPFQEWLEALRDIRGRALIRKRLDRLTLGNLGEYKRLQNGISEFKLIFGPGYRVYFAEDGNSIIVLLCAGDKGSQNVDIKKAQKYWKSCSIRTGCSQPLQKQ